MIAVGRQAQTIVSVVVVGTRVGQQLRIRVERNYIFCLYEQMVLF